MILHKNDEGDQENDFLSSPVAPEAGRHAGARCLKSKIVFLVALAIFMKNLFNKRQSACLKASFEILHEGVPEIRLNLIVQPRYPIGI